MRAIVHGLAICAAIATTAAQAAAQAPLPPQVWQLDWQSPHCQLSTGDPQTAGLSLWMVPGDPVPSLYIVGPESVLPPGENGTVFLDPGGKAFPVEAGQGPGGKIGFRMLVKLKADFLPAFAASEHLRYVASGRTLTLATHGADEALKALRTCNDSKLPAWGIDPGTFNALQQPPTTIDGYSWISNTDYPSAALNANVTGTVTSRVDVDVSGRVTKCSLVATSGSTALDDAVCPAMLKRGKFNPAIGADGQPTAAQRIVATTFRIAN